MRKILAIAQNTFIEGIRAKTLYIIIAYGLLILLGMTALTPLALGEQARIVQDLGLAGIEVMGMLLAIIVGTTLVYKEVEKRTIYVMVSKPLSRWQFLAGKYLGMEILAATVVSLMTILFFFGLLLMKQGFMGILVFPILLIFLKISIINALALLFSSLASPVLGAVFTFCLYLAGTLSRDILELADRMKLPLINLTMKVIYYFLPNLGNLDMKNSIIFNHQVIWPQIWWGLAYSLTYIISVMLIAVLAFEKKDFK
jgi:ABC-type transport system involved in multi-copper enzyme maturation permease subunit